MVKYTTEHWNWAYYKGNYVPLQILQQINNSHILCVTPYTLSNEDCLMQWEIVTTKMSIPIIKWYRTFLAHTGCKQLQWQYKSDTIIQSLEKCCLFPFWLLSTWQDPMQRNGSITQTQPHQHNMVQSSVDLIEPQSAKKEYFYGEFYELTCIDTTTNLVALMSSNTTTNLVELTSSNTKSSDVIL